MSEAAQKIDSVFVLEGNGNNQSREEALGKEISLIESQAESIVIVDKSTLEIAVSLVAEIKKRIEEANEFFEPMRKATYEAYNSVLARKKNMTDPLKKAESILKKSISDYQTRQEEIRLEEERKAREALRSQIESKMEEAVSAEKNGDSAAADNAMGDAAALESLSYVGTPATAPEKVKGLSTKFDWEIADIDERLVPISVNGVMIRPVDTKAILKMAKATKGQIQIPGVTFRKVAKTSIRKA